MNNNYFFNNIYPEFNSTNNEINNKENIEINKEINNNQNNKLNNENNNVSSIISNVIPLLLSGKNIAELLPNILNITQLNNPIISQLFNNKNKNENKKIESDKIDISSLTKC